MASYLRWLLWAPFLSFILSITKHFSIIYPGDFSNFGSIFFLEKPKKKRKEGRKKEKEREKEEEERGGEGKGVEKRRGEEKKEEERREERKKDPLWFTLTGHGM